MVYNGFSNWYKIATRLKIIIFYCLVTYHRFVTTLKNDHGALVVVSCHESVTISANDICDTLLCCCKCHELATNLQIRKHALFYVRYSSQDGDTLKNTTLYFYLLSQHCSELKRPSRYYALSTFLRNRNDIQDKT